MCFFFVLFLQKHIKFKEKLVFSRLIVTHKQIQESEFKLALRELQNGWSAQDPRVARKTKEFCPEGGEYHPFNQSVSMQGGLEGVKNELLLLVKSHLKCKLQLCKGVSLPVAISDLS